KAAPFGSDVWNLVKNAARLFEALCCLFILVVVVSNVTASFDTDRSPALVAKLVVQLERRVEMPDRATVGVGSRDVAEQFIALRFVRSVAFIASSVDESAQGRCRRQPRRAMKFRESICGVRKAAHQFGLAE